MLPLSWALRPRACQPLASMRSSRASISSGSSLALPTRQLPRRSCSAMRPLAPALLLAGAAGPVAAAATPLRQRSAGTSKRPRLRRFGQRPSNCASPSLRPSSSGGWPGCSSRSQGASCARSALFQLSCQVSLRPTGSRSPCSVRRVLCSAGPTCSASRELRCDCAEAALGVESSCHCPLSPRPASRLGCRSNWARPRSCASPSTLRGALAGHCSLAPSWPLSSCGPAANSRSSALALSA